MEVYDTNFHSKGFTGQNGPWEPPRPPQRAVSVPGYEKGLCYLNFIPVLVAPGTLAVKTSQKIQATKVMTQAGPTRAGPGSAPSWTGANQDRAFAV